MARSVLPFPLAKAATRGLPRLLEATLARKLGDSALVVSVEMGRDMSLLITWTPFFQANVRRQGKALQLAGQVERQEPMEGEWVRARVAEENEQHVVVMAPEGERHITAECSCPTFASGRFCPHIWATLLDLQHNPEAPGAAAGDLAKRTVRPPKARKRVETEPTRREAEPEWMGRLSLLRPSGDELRRRAGELLPNQRQICYVILPQLSARHNGLVVTLRQRHAIASGWSKPKPLKLTGDALSGLTDPVDRELCALIVGGSWVNDSLSADAFRYERSHTTYRLAPGAGQSLLKRLIDTGRAFVDLSEDEDRPDQRPLQWAGEQPWVLWLVGQWEEADSESADQGGPSQSSLHLTLELRRGEQRLGVGEPALVLGGRDGLVLHQGQAAPLDDREAFHWISQFRQEFLAEDDDTRPMTVPYEDVARFLDRLYMLPQLPELDLPEGLAEPEQAATPMPHLELFSPSSPEASELIGSRGVTKNQLVGRVWFDYAGHRVRPTQPGQFVPINPAANAQAQGEDAEAADDAEAQEPVAVGAAASQEADEPSSAAGEPEQPAPQASTGEGSHQAAAAAPRRQLIRRDRRAEQDALAMLGSVGARQTAATSNEAVLLATRWLGPAVSELMNRGWVVTADRKSLHTGGPPSLSISSGIDWFELRGSVTYQQADGTEQEITLPEILAAARSGEQMITLGDGSQGLLPESWLADHGLLTQMGEVQDDALVFRPNQAALLDSMLAEKELTHADPTFQQARERLRQFEGIQPLEPDAAFQGALREYQREGLGWMAFLRWFGMGGILADDMGLGKTIQVLAVLQARHNGAAEHTKGDMYRPTSPEADGAEHRPSLIVVPRSVVFNWVDEARKFTPDLRVLAYTGSDRQSLRDAFQEHDVIVTSYGLMRRDIEELRHFGFDYVVLDEAQAIKNPSSQAAKAARLLDAPHRLALTGTPIENHLGDLWSIFEFLNPGMLGASARFSELVRASGAGGRGNGQPATNGDGQADAQNEPQASAATADASEGAAEARELDEEAESAVGEAPVQQIAQALRPFILRRSKQQVLKDLPEKTEQTIICQMEQEQRQVYDELRQYYRGNLMKQLDDAGTKRSDALGGQAFMVLEALLRLRQAACHPGLIDEKRQAEQSAKLEALEQMLGDVIDEGGKALVFSQFTSMLGLVKQRFDQLGIKYVYLDGQTRNREEVVKQFQNDDSIQVFLISLKAGGFGLNLTAAEYVFILDPWWNPAVESQAIDRTHRIGQSKPVFAYRMICEDTVEQRVIELQQAKRDLADAIVGGEENLLKSLSRDDLEQLLS
jgi:superfamily II DNA or RNA helicase